MIEEYHSFVLTLLAGVRSALNLALKLRALLSHLRLSGLAKVTYYA